MVKRMMGFQISTVFIIILALISYVGIQSMVNSYKWVSHTIEVLFQVHRVKDNVSDSQVSLREFVFGDDPSLINRYYDKSVGIPQELDNLQWLTRDNAEQQKNIFTLRMLIDRKLQLYRDVMEVYKTKGKAEAQAKLIAGFGEPFHAGVRNQTEQIESAENRLLALRMRDYENRSSLALYGIPLLIILYLVVFNVSLRMLTIKLQEQQC